MLSPGVEDGCTQWDITSRLVKPSTEHFDEKNPTKTNATCSLADNLWFSYWFLHNWKSFCNQRSRPLLAIRNNSGTFMKICPTLTYSLWNGHIYCFSHSWQFHKKWLLLMLKTLFLTKLLCPKLKPLLLVTMGRANAAYRFCLPWFSPSQNWLCTGTVSGSTLVKLVSMMYVVMWSVRRAMRRCGMLGWCRHVQLYIIWFLVILNNLSKLKHGSFNFTCHCFLRYDPKDKKNSPPVK